MLANCPPNPDPYTCAPHDCLNGDIDGDGDVDYDDISLFVGALGGTAPRRTFTWDAENRLRAVTPVSPAVGDLRAEFAYDYLGRRTVQTVSSWTGSAWTVVSETKYVWAGWLMLMELDGLSDCGTPGAPAECVVRKYTWGLDLAGQAGSVGVPPASLQSAGGIGGLLAVSQAEVGGGQAQGGVDAGDYVYFYDANGNVGQVFDPATQTVAAHYEYDPFGNVTNDLSGYAYAETNRWRFSTHQYDPATGLIYAKGRYYDAVLGRWLNRDPIGEGGFGLARRVAGARVPSYFPGGKGADQVHLYGYVRNMPCNLVDPLGLEETSASSDSCCVCGPDITDALQRLLADVDSAFGDLEAWEKDDLCDGYIDAASWDTHLFSRAWLFQIEGCPKGAPCEYDNKVPGVRGGASITVDGKCFASFDVNYVLYGRMMKNCGVWNMSKANSWFIIYKTPWWTSHSWRRWTHAALWMNYGLLGGVVEPDSPDNLKSCEPCSKEWTGPIHWFVYGDNNVSIGNQ